MGKRFGRNQKRQMRERNEALENRVASCEWLAERQRGTIEALDSYIQEIQELVGRHHAFMEPAEIEGLGDHESGFLEVERPTIPPMDSLLSMNISRVDPMAMTVAVEVLPKMVAQWHREGVNTQHAVIKHAGHQVAYAVDPRMLAKMGRQRLIQRIAKQMAEILANEYIRTYGGDQ